MADDEKAEPKPTKKNWQQEAAERILAERALAAAAARSAQSYLAAQGIRGDVERSALRAATEYLPAGYAFPPGSGLSAALASGIVHGKTEREIELEQRSAKLAE